MIHSLQVWKSQLTGMTFSGWHMQKIKYTCQLTNVNWHMSTDINTWKTILSKMAAGLAHRMCHTAHCTLHMWSCTAFTIRGHFFDHSAKYPLLHHRGPPISTTTVDLLYPQLQRTSSIHIYREPPLSTATEDLLYPQLHSSDTLIPSFSRWVMASTALEWLCAICFWPPYTPSPMLDCFSGSLDVMLLTGTWW